MPDDWRSGKRWHTDARRQEIEARRKDWRGPFVVLSARDDAK